MAQLKGSRTEKNILTAFAGESQARNRYTYFAAKAKKEGYEQISHIFLETAEQEKEHAKRLFKLLEGGACEITASFPAGSIGSTLENLTEAAGGENYEYSSMYPAFAAIAQSEGMNDIADIFLAIAIAEKQHERRYLALVANITNNTVFKKESVVSWRCRNCGYVHTAADTPDCCPACNHARAHFELLAENW